MDQARWVTFQKYAVPFPPNSRRTQGPPYTLVDVYDNSYISQDGDNFNAFDNRLSGFSESRYRTGRLMLGGSGEFYVDIIEPEPRIETDDELGSDDFGFGDEGRSVGDSDGEEVFDE